MKIFKHKHKRDYSKDKTKLACSLLTGVPVQVSYQYFCKCGKELRRELSGAGYQELYSFGAIEESLYDDGPIRQRENWIPPKPVMYEFIIGQGWRVYENVS